MPEFAQDVAGIIGSGTHLVSELRHDRVEAFGPLDPADEDALHWVYVLRLRPQGVKRRGKPRWAFTFTSSAAHRIGDSWLVAAKYDDRSFIVTGRASAGAGVRLDHAELMKLEPSEYDTLETLLAVASEAWTKRHGNQG